MPPADRPADAGFWRCGHCGTPNPAAGYVTHCVGCGRVRTIPRPVAAKPAPRVRGRIAKWPWPGSLAYAGIVLLAFGFLRLFAERWWPATLMLLMPRWLFLVPIVPLAALAAWVRSGRAAVVLALTALFVAGPFMGFVVPVARLTESRPPGPVVRVMTLNRGPARLDVGRLARLIDREKIDVVCFQEYQKNPELDRYFARGWYQDARKTLASRHPIVGELPLDNDDDFPEYGFWPVRISRVRVKLPSGREVGIASVHMPTLRKGFSLVRGGDVAALGRYDAWRWKQIEQLVVRLQEFHDLPVIVGGDFNMSADSPMMSLLRPSFRVGFEEAGWGYGYTRPTGRPWVGIDHILGSPECAFRRCWVGPDVGSDHLPMIAEVVLREAGR